MAASLLGRARLETRLAVFGTLLTLVTVTASFLALQLEIRRQTRRLLASSLARHGRHSDGAMKPYHCRVCDFWHLGHRRGAFGRA